MQPAICFWLTGGQDLLVLSHCAERNILPTSSGDGDGDGDAKAVGDDYFVVFLGLTLAVPGNPASRGNRSSRSPHGWQCSRQETQEPSATAQSNWALVSISKKFSKTLFLVPRGLERIRELEPRQDCHRPV